METPVKVANNESKLRITDARGQFFERIHGEQLVHYGCRNEAGKLVESHETKTMKPVTDALVSSLSQSSKALADEVIHSQGQYGRMDGESVYKIPGATPVLNHFCAIMRKGNHR